MSEKKAKQSRSAIIVAELLLKIAASSARSLAHAKLDTLTVQEQLTVSLLEQGHYLFKPDKPNGYAGGLAI